MRVSLVALVLLLVYHVHFSTTQPTATNDDSQHERQYNQQLAEDEYLVGVGIADITGPAADINLMGYAKPNQDAGGIHLRQFSRAVMIEDRAGSRVLYVNLDNGMVSQLLRTNVLARLKQRFGPTTFNATNVMLTAMHSHSCPGGFFQYMLYNIPSAGFIRQTLEALTDGILRSIERALEVVEPARLYLNKGDLLDASMNRSPSAYANNPAAERASYAHDTDKEMFVLRVVDRAHKPLAMLNWFAVHGTSMNNSNHLISSDNKGYAALLMERDYNPAGTMPGKGKFVALFAQANEGDVSPNTSGPRCVDTGLPCDPLSSTCGDPPRNEKCIAFGPGRDMFESTKIIAHKQYAKAKQLFEGAREQVRGPVRSVHQHIDMAQQHVPSYESATLVHAAKQRRRLAESPQNSTHEQQAALQTCRPALGYSFAAGTTDGPGAFDFQQGDTVSTKYWNMVRDFLKRPSPELVRCQAPKPILLATGQMDFPYMWHSRVVPTQLFMVGQLAIVGLPGEFTTMAGRRVREAVRRSLTSAGDQSSGPDAPQQVQVVLSGLSNIYTSYITTIEEYEVQRYEGASTLYGPHTLQAYVNQFAELARMLISGKQPDDSLQPPDLSSSLFTIKTGVVFDSAPHGTNFGSLLRDADTEHVYKPHDLVVVTFVAGNPRNDLMQEQSFLYVELFDESSSNWTLVATDASWETKFIWERTNTLFGESRASIEWHIPHQCHSGVYRIRHVGAHKSLLQVVSHYSGQSSPFKVMCTSANEPDASREQMERLESLRQQVAQLQEQQQEADSTLQRMDKRNNESFMSTIGRYFSSILHFRRA